MELRIEIDFFQNGNNTARITPPTRTSLPVPSNSHADNFILKRSANHNTVTPELSAPAQRRTPCLGSLLNELILALQLHHHSRPPSTAETFKLNIRTCGEGAMGRLCADGQNQRTKSTWSSTTNISWMVGIGKSN